MTGTTLALECGITLDARRALWIAQTRTLVAADLHAGYAWAQRHAGNLVPLSAHDDIRDRLLALVRDYAPRELVLLGDIVHDAVPVPEFLEELRTLFGALRAATGVVCVEGNHDRKLAALLRECAIDLPLVREHRAGPHLLLHGDGKTRRATARTGCVVIGHEHPAIGISDGVAHHVKCPCFLVSSRLIVMPAFSMWAAGGSARGGQFLSAFARRAKFERAMAILAGKLLPVEC
jgi:hypothetical protein